MPVQPPVWEEARLEADRQIAIEQFREERITESLDAYLGNFARYRSAIERLLDTTQDLSALAQEASNVLADQDLLYTTRYLTGPPVSEDDLKVIADARLTPSQIRTDLAGTGRIVETILRGLDRERLGGSPRSGNRARRSAASPSSRPRPCSPHKEPGPDG